MARFGPEPRPVEDRFWDHVTTGTAKECWPWEGARYPDGYGFLQLSRSPPRFVRAHRVSWEIHNGPIPEGLVICHHCDNPPCVNPRHLFLGTRKDNNADRAAKGRGRENRQDGEANANVKLMEAEVRAIIAVLRTGRSQTATAKMFGIKQPQVSRIARRKSWQHLWEE